MFHTPAHKVAPNLPQAGTIENIPFAADPRVIVDSGKSITDVLVWNHGSVFLLQPMTSEGREWLEQNLIEPARWADSYAVEHRYIDRIIEGMIDDSLEVA